MPNTKQMEYQLRIYTFAVVIVFMIASIGFQLINFGVLHWIDDDHMIKLLSRLCFTVSWFILYFYLRFMNHKFLKKYNTMLESRAYATEQVFKNQQILTQEDYLIIKDLVADYEKSHIDED